MLSRYIVTLLGLFAGGLAFGAHAEIDCKANVPLGGPHFAHASAVLGCTTEPEWVGSGASEVHRANLVTTCLRGLPRGHFAAAASMK
jgi:hypothetical protein